MRREAEARQRNAKNDVVFKNRDNNTKKIGFYSSSTCFSARSNYDFFADSGASHHISDQRSYFSSMTTIQKGVWLVKGIGVVTLPVLGQGSIDFPATVDGKQYPGEFTEVLFVPSFNATLISVGTTRLSHSGWIFSAFFFVVVLGFMGLLLVIVFINLDITENRGPFHNLSFAAYCMGLLHLLFKLLNDALLVRGWLYAIVTIVSL